MNTKGHHYVALVAGIKLLQQAFAEESEAEGMSIGKRNLAALYLGNWLTDLSQTVDPIAYRSGFEKVNSLEPEELIEIINQKLPASVQSVWKRLGGDEALKEVIVYFKRILIEDFKRLIAFDTQERQSELAIFFRRIVRMMGYFKFAYPTDDTPALDGDVYVNIFGRFPDVHGAANNSPGAASESPGRFTQYYPHEHLDRPELFPVKRGEPSVFSPHAQSPGNVHNFPSKLSPHPRSTRGDRKQSSAPDLYPYLRDHLQMTAGLLAEVDMAMKKFLRTSFKDDDPEWCLTLSKLGHALHQVEDFFAHSNWAELAFMKMVNPSLTFDSLFEEHLEKLDEENARTILLKRLRVKYKEPLDDWWDHELEDWVVTGSFEFSDTLVSLAHLSEEMWGLSDEDEDSKSPSKKDEFTKLLLDTFKFVHTFEKAVEDEENTVAQQLKDRFEKDKEQLREPEQAREVAEAVIRMTPYLQRAPEQIQDDFVDTIVQGAETRKTSEENKGVMSFFEKLSFLTSIFLLLHSINSFISDIKHPIKTLKKWKRTLKMKALFYFFDKTGLTGKLWDVVEGIVKEPFYTKLVYANLATESIGSHSLLAKDHGAEPFYTFQQNCAIAMHWYIVKLLLRWKDHEGAQHIDWLELLEHFLSNPLNAEGTRIRIKRTIETTTIQHDVKEGDTLASLGIKYKKTAGNPQKFSWRTIADANFNTGNLPPNEAKDKINEILAEMPDKAYRVANGNYAFKEAYGLLAIPDQRIVFEEPEVAYKEPEWYEDVFKQGWTIFSDKFNEAQEAEVAESDDNERSKQETTGAPEFKYHKPKVIRDNNVFKLFIEESKVMRQKARDEYTVSKAFQP